VGVTVELRGLELLGHHGTEEAEREAGQRFLFDLWLDVGDAGLSDRLEDAVDYREVVACVREVSDGRRFHLLEALAAADCEIGVAASSAGIEVLATELYGNARLSRDETIARLLTLTERYCVVFQTLTGGVPVKLS